MKLCIVLVFGTLIALAYGMPPISRDYNTHCRCVQVESRIIPPDSLRSIKLFPKGPHCPDIEVIAGLASGEKVCLNPRSVLGEEAHPVLFLQNNIIQRLKHSIKRQTVKRVQ
ncbi:hypothetical protein KUCAC02_000537 [Chaenocephalus aceratus]|uniref:Uncharacterized protein n=1 Tax=Chaenocephalus aceratus TaxID=36190 RepID=A0ACB9W5W0_CHAAC|nr:hypothetical protein KUCAC02_000537 [Chaenocephalus aceratus]